MNERRRRRRHVKDVLEGGAQVDIICPSPKEDNSTKYMYEDLSESYGQAHWHW